MPRGGRKGGEDAAPPPPPKPTHPSRLLLKRDCQSARQRQSGESQAVTGQEAHGAHTREAGRERKQPGRRPGGRAIAHATGVVEHRPGRVGTERRGRKRASAAGGARMKTKAHESTVGGGAARFDADERVAGRKVGTCRTRVRGGDTHTRTRARARKGDKKKRAGEKKNNNKATGRAGEGGRSEERRRHVTHTFVRERVGQRRVSN